MEKFTLVFTKGIDGAIMQTKKKGTFAVDVERTENGSTLVMVIDPVSKVMDSPAPVQSEIPTSNPAHRPPMVVDNGKHQQQELAINDPNKLWNIIEDRMAGLHDASPRLSFYLNIQLDRTGLNLNEASRKTRKRVSASKIADMIRPPMIKPPAKKPPQFQGLKVVMVMKEVLGMRPDAAIEVLEKFDVLATAPEVPDEAVAV